MASRIERENTLDIELAARTLAFIESVINIIPADLFRKMRSLVTNLVDFQNRFAKPMLLPFHLGNDFVQNLEVRRPISVLLRFKVAFPLAQHQHPGTTDVDDCIDVDGQRYCIVGGKTWKELVDRGALTGGDAIKPTVTAFSWLPYLFHVLAVSTGASLEVKAEARRLAACWAHVASQVDYTAKPEDEEEEFDATPLIESLTASAKMGLAELEKDPSLMDEYDDDEDEDFNPEASGESESDDDIEEEEDVEDMQVEGEGLGKPAEGEKVEEDEDMPALEDVGVQTTRPPSPEKAVIQTVVFDTVKLLQAYMPDPDTDIEWFKRVLKDVKVAQVTGEKEWYPFGCPPMEPLIECLKQDFDPFSKQMASSIITLFQSQLQPTESQTQTQ